MGTDEKWEHPWGEEEDRAKAGKRRKARPVLTPRQADSLARSIERLERRRLYSRIGGIDEDFDL